MIHFLTRLFILISTLSLALPPMADASVLTRTCEAFLQIASGRIEKIDPDLVDKTDEQFLIRISRSVDFKVGSNPDSLFRTSKEQKKIIPYVVKRPEPFLFRTLKKVKTVSGQAILMQQVELMAEAVQTNQTFYLVFREGRPSPIGLIQVWVSENKSEMYRYQLNSRAYLLDGNLVRKVFSDEKLFLVMYF